MNIFSKFWRVSGILLLALAGCSPLSPGTQPLATPAVTNSATLPPMAIVSATPPATTAPAPPFTGLHMLDAQNGWAWADSGQLLRTSDGGRTWIDRSAGAGSQPLSGTYLDDQTAWLPTYDSTTNQGGLLQTSDGGQTWTQISYGPANPAFPEYGLHFLNAQNGWAESADVGAGNIYYTLYGTQDGGKTWAALPVKGPSAEAGLPPGTIHLCNICEDSLYYDPARLVIVHGGEASMQSTGSVQMQVSFDQGSSWKEHDLPLPRNAADAIVGHTSATFFNDGSGLLSVQLMKLDSTNNISSQRLVFYASPDGGTTWSLLPGQLDDVGNFPLVQVIDSQNLLAVHGSSLYTSHDGAQTWQKIASNLDFTQNDSRTLLAMDFVDPMTGWTLIKHDNVSLLYHTTDGGASWEQLNPRAAASAPVKVNLNPGLPTLTPLPTPTLEPTATNDIAFDPAANAYRVRFAPYGTWIEIGDNLPANGSKRYILSAMQGQVMSAAVAQGPAYQLAVTGADKKPLNDPQFPEPFWRGKLPSTQDYYVTVSSQTGGPFSLRIAINPPGQETQNFWFIDPQTLAVLSYPDEFAPTSRWVPVTLKGKPLLTLEFIDSSFYSKTNLNEAFLVLAASSDPAVVSTCLQPLSQVPETITGQVNFTRYTFIRSEYQGAAAGNQYDQIAYRNLVNNTCFEVVFLIHNGNIANYPPGSVAAFDRDGLLKKFEAVLDSFGVK